MCCWKAGQTPRTYRPQNPLDPGAAHTTMNGAASNAFLASSKLGDLFASLPVNDQPQQWNEIELTAQSLANDLRVRDGAQPQHSNSLSTDLPSSDLAFLSYLVERQTALGKTLLPQTLTSLLKGATDGAAVPKPTQKPAIFELLRVGANLCMDHGTSIDLLSRLYIP